MTLERPFVDEWPSRRLAVFALLRIVLTVVVLLTAYAVIPLNSTTEVANWLYLTVGLTVFGAVLVWQVREVSQAPRPVLRALEALAITVTFFLVLFASQYVAESLASPEAFSEPLTRLAGLYYTMTVFSTVGFGDITPKSDAARVVTMFQMLGNIVVLGIGVRLLTSVAKDRIDRRRAELEGQTGA